MYASIPELLKAIKQKKTPVTINVFLAEMLFTENHFTISKI